MLRLICPGCERRLGVPETQAGKVCVCPSCQTRFTVPEPEPESATVPANASRQRNRVEDKEDKATPPPRRPRVRDADVDEQPPRRRSRAADSDRADDEDDREELDDRPARRRGKRRKPVRRRTGAGPGAFAISLMVVGGGSLLLLGLALLCPLAALPVVLGGFVLIVIGAIWFHVVAFREGAAEGLMCLFVPFYALYYLISRFDEEKLPFLVQLVGVAIYGAGIGVVVSHGIGVE